MKSAYVGVLLITELKNARWNIEIQFHLFPKLRETNKDPFFPRMTFPGRKGKEAWGYREMLLAFIVNRLP